MNARLSIAFIVDSVPFTKAVRDGETSLGGSESACVGLARALQARGHDIHIFASKMQDDAIGVDVGGVTWHPIELFAPMNAFFEWDVVVALRWFGFFGQLPLQARLRLLWNQDLLVPGGMQAGVMSIAWALDHLVYVSDYHRAQWEDLEPPFATPGVGWVTKNGFDPAHLPQTATKDPQRIIHISRPERGLKPLLNLWPQLRKRHPHATLQICRYSSMYDQGPGSWSDTCAQFDRAVEACNADVGGITYLGELNKRQLYQAISEAAVMWYPGVATFAETSCCAAVEAQACGTPFVGSLRGALVETAQPSYDAGLLIQGDAEHDEAYAEASLDAVSRLLDGCAHQSFAYRQLQRAGKKHVEAYTFARLAAEWEAQIETWFRERYQQNTVRIMRQLLHEDDHVAALEVALDVLDAEFANASAKEADEAKSFCQHVIAGKDQTADQYGDAAIADPLKEAEFSERFRIVIPHFADCTRVLDVACGNGSFAIALAKAHPTVFVQGFDYSAANIARAIDGAERAGVADRCHFAQLTVYDFETQTMHPDWDDFEGEAWEPFDGLFVGEFVEHVAACTLLIDRLEAHLTEGATVVYTCPRGNCAELVPRWMPLRRGHVHNFHQDDLAAVFGPKLDFEATYLPSGMTERGNPIGNWLIRYTVAHGRAAGQRPIATRVQRTRPLQKLSIGIIAKDAECDLAKCLTSVWPIADEIVVGDTGSRDHTIAIAQEFNARVLQLDPVDMQPEGFSGARNAVLTATTGDWFFWIDADEQLLEGHALRRYLDGPIFHGFVLSQTHLYIDAAPTHDVPVRVFRTGRGVRFYGCVHEQPQQGDPNADIFPTLHPADVLLAHVGYLTERTRQEKREGRNLPLLAKDQRVFPTRVLGQVLCLREAVIQSDCLRADAGGQMTTKAAQGYALAIHLFIEHFDDPAHKYHKLARPWYEAAMRALGVGFEFELAMAGRKGGLHQTRAAPERIWVRDADEVDRLVRWKLADMQTHMRPAVFKTEPFVRRPAGVKPRAVAAAEVPVEREIAGVPV